MRSGCALVDFGADTTTISVYKNNILRYLSVLPLGGNTITHDITSLQMEEQDAEKLKLQYGNALYEEEEDTETPAVCTLDDGRAIELATLNNIVEARHRGNPCQRMEPAATLRLRGQTLLRSSVYRWRGKPEEHRRCFPQTKQNGEEKNHALCS